MIRPSQLTRAGRIRAAASVVFLTLLAVLMVTGPARASTAPLLLVKSDDLALLQAQATADGVTLPAFTWTGCGGLSDPLACQPGQTPIVTSYFALRTLARHHYAGPAIYDVETWSYTPANQRANPLYWICRAARLVKADPQLQVIVTPYSPSPAFMIREDAEAARCGAYGVDIQSQWTNGHPKVFRAFVEAAVDAIRAKSGTVTILAGLATNNPVPQTIAHLRADWTAGLADGVDGFWVNAASWTPTRCTAAEGGTGCPQTGVALLIKETTS